MIQVLKGILFSRKFWVGVLTGGLNAGITQMNLTPEITVMLMKAVTALGVFIIGGIAYEDGKAKQAGILPSTVIKDAKVNIPPK